MDAHQPPPPLRLAVAPSRQLRRFVVATHALALLVALLMAWHYPPALLLLPLLAASAWDVRREHLAADSPRRVCELLWDSAGEWTLTQVDGHERAAKLGDQSVVHPRFMALNFRLDRWQRRTVLLLADNADAEAQRALRVRIRTTASQ